MDLSFKALETTDGSNTWESPPEVNVG